MAGPTCLNCPKEYWIAFVLESHSREEHEGKNTLPAMASGEMAQFSFTPASGSEWEARPLSLIRNIVWVDLQRQPMNDVLIEYHLCEDIEAHVNLLDVLAYGKVLP